MYEYRAKLARVVDGDTVYLEVDLGFHIRTELSFRLLGIDAPEVRGSERTAGLKSKAVLEELLTKGTITVKTEKTGKYGRWLATIFVDDGASKFNVNEELVKLGHAEIYDE